MAYEGFFHFVGDFGGLELLIRSIFGQEEK